MSAREIAPQPLLCELHCHTTWSDGDLTPDELVDLYGTAGFDVLCVTDHVVGPNDPGGPMIGARNHGAYIDDDRRGRRGGPVAIWHAGHPRHRADRLDADADLAAHALASASTGW